MFTGIVEATGVLVEKSGDANAYQFVIKPNLYFEDVLVGDSLSVNGVCLTATKIDNQCIYVDVVPETLQRTNLGMLIPGVAVNLERSMKANGRMGGHYVQGHVDFTGEIMSIRPDGNKAWLVEISYPREYSHYLVDKGYVTIDGMSITIIEVFDGSFSVTFIPHTQTATIVKTYKNETLVNIEVDMMGKYIEKIMRSYRS